MTQQENLFKYILRLGDSAVIHGHRLSEWCSNGPILEEDLALTNIALDYIGRAQALLKYASEIEAKDRTADDLVYKRDERQFYNLLITELPKGNFAFTMAKQLILSCYEFYLYTALSQSKDETLAAIAVKSLKEIRYHLSHAKEWSFRLGKGTDLSNEKLQEAYQELWPFTDELFEMNESDKELLDQGISIDLQSLKNQWIELMSSILKESSISLPTSTYMQTGSGQGIHTEYFGHLLTEMQFLQRAYPDATW
ncbi:MAG: phenylacetate-CoA oxygenase subunit PaaC [Chitinophagaceae bacterium]|nr:phenylacetate-CoA oxygenase subunit PaaC [Chitinophagaceae bacterium]